MNTARAGGSQSRGRMAGKRHSRASTKAIAGTAQRPLGWPSRLTPSEPPASTPASLLSRRTRTSGLNSTAQHSSAPAAETNFGHVKNELAMVKLEKRAAARLSEIPQRGRRAAYNSAQSPKIQ